VALQSLKGLGRLTYRKFLELSVSRYRKPTRHQGLGKTFTKRERLRWCFRIWNCGLALFLNAAINGGSYFKMLQHFLEDNVPLSNRALCYFQQGGHRPHFSLQLDRYRRPLASPVRSTDRTSCNFWPLKTVKKRVHTAKAQARSHYQAYRYRVVSSHCSVSMYAHARWLTARDAPNWGSILNKLSLQMLLFSNKN
jgi:hypothetical protein